MTRTFRFLWRFSWPGWLATFCLAGVVLLGTAAAGVSAGRGNLFSAYFFSFPFILLLLTTLLSLGRCSAYLDLALSFGAVRRQLFLCLQGILVLDALVGCAAMLLLLKGPWALSWAGNEALYILFRTAGWLGWRFPLSVFAQSVLGCVAGLALSKSKALGSILTAFATLLPTGILTATLSIQLFGPDWLGPLMTGVVAVAGLAGEAVLLRWIGRYSVR